MASRWTIGLLERYCEEREHGISALDAADLLEDRARAVARTRLPLPLLERFPRHVCTEADQDVSLHALGLLMPVRPQNRYQPKLLGFLSSRE